VVLVIVSTTFRFIVEDTSLFGGGLRLFFYDQSKKKRNLLEWENMLNSPSMPSFLLHILKLRERMNLMKL